MKIRKIKFENHFIFGNLELDFCDSNGRTVDTIIIAGENGTGKSFLLNTIFNLSNFNVEHNKKNEKRYYEFELFDEEIEIFKSNNDFIDFFSLPIKGNIIYIDIDYSIVGNWSQINAKIIKSDNSIISVPGHLFSQSDTRKILKTLFSDVEINFTPNQISSVTAKNLDNDNFLSEKSNTNLASEIKQLLIDIQSIDALEFTEWARSNLNSPIDETKIDVRMKRFSAAFEYMFPNKQYIRVETKNNLKDIIFSEYGKEMSISELSSGEKQIVFRGSFLLKDKKSSKGALILIDEPEISMHPTWQLKILTFFKKLFTDNNKQTSQLIIATHSPFIIHNSNRNQDKIIVLKKDESGAISTMSDPLFYSWSQEKKISAAFNVSGLLRSTSINVFLEGETDEKYFQKTQKIFGINENEINFKWIGRINESGNIENSGDTALNQAKAFFRANEELLIYTVILFYDNDTKKPDEDFPNLYIRKMSSTQYNNIYSIGVESLLSLNQEFETTQFYNEEIKKDNYGAKSIIRKLDKSALCNHIVNDLDLDSQKEILKYLKKEIERLLTIK